MVFELERSFANDESFAYLQEDLNEEVNKFPLWNILPSYAMYSNSFYQNPADPPEYLDSTSTEQSQQNSAIGSLGTTTNSDADNAPVTVDDQNTMWENCILDNIHKLQNISDSNNEVSKNIKIDTYFTKEICKMNGPFEIIDPSKFEYKQGDYINGFITIENNNDFLVPFKMMYVLFEGTVTIGKSKKNFLQMFDFSGSFQNSTHVNRLVTEYQNSYVCPYLVDKEGFHLSFTQSTMRPGTKYKRFFSFKIPNHLLDNECPSYTLESHVLLPPSLGGVKDFSHMSTSINYNVHCRFIGKASTYNFNPAKENVLVTNSEGDEYVIFKERSSEVRVIAKSNPIKLESVVYQDLLYNNLIKRIDEKLMLGNKLSKILQLQKFDQIDNLVDCLQEQIAKESTNKIEQLYTPSAVGKIPPTKYLEFKVDPIKSILKKQSPLKVITPDVNYEIPYIPLKKFRSKGSSPNVNLSIPFQFISAENSEPKFKFLHTDVVCLTIKSDTPIPLEFNHKMVYKNSKPNESMFKSTDNFQNNIVNFFRQKFFKVKELSKSVNIENIKLEKSLLDEIKTLASLQEKTINLTIKDAQISQDGQLTKSIKWVRNSDSVVAKLNVELDMAKLSMKGVGPNSSTDFTLLPDFQGCYLGRMYFLKMYFEFQNYRALVHLPLSVVNS